jgi:tripeptide aminopeptidase
MSIVKRKPAAVSSASQAPPEPDLKAAFELVMQLMAIPGVSGHEGQVARFIVKKLRQAGAPAASISTDTAHRRSPLKGEIGNLIFKLPGTLRGKRRLLMAHLDTVPLVVGCKPVRKGAFVRSADKRTGLGADDRAGAAVVLTAAVEILRRKLPHPPVTFFWPVQEEVGLHGARFASLGALGKPQLAFNWDGGPAERLAVGATGAYRMTIRVHGVASHAGGAPEHGVSAIGIAGLAIAELQRNGWHGKIDRAEGQGTSNIGVFHGGDATNVVTPYVEIRAEARSHDPQFRQQIVRAIEQAFQRAAAEVKNVAGDCGQVLLDARLDYEAFRLADQEPCVLAAESAIRGIGGEPFRAVTNGGLDANWMTAHGIPTVTLGCGQVNVHTVGEQLDIAAFQKGCRIGLRLATGTEVRTEFGAVNRG